MTDEKITHITIDEIRAKIARGDARMTAAVIDMMTDEQIEAAMRDDPDWKDHIDDDWSKAEPVIPKAAIDQLVQVAVDAVSDNVDWVRGLFGGKYGCAQDVMRDVVCAVLSSISKPPPVGTLQSRVQPWMMACFGPEISADKLERGDRFLEEAIELLQSVNYPRERIYALIEYVYGRDQGEINQEVGGVMITLAAFCLAHGQDMHEAGETELARIWTKVEKIRAKHAAKPTGSALPVAASVLPDLAAENARLREALTPFAAEADEHDGASAIFSAEVPIAWLRAARAAHKGGAA